MPNKLRGINEPDEISFYGGFDKISNALSSAEKEFCKDNWIKAAEIFQEACPLINEIKKIIVNYLVEEEDKSKELPMILKDVLNIYFDGFKYFI